MISINFILSIKERKLILREAVLTKIVNKAFMCGEVYISQDQILLTESEESSVRSSTSLPSLPRQRHVLTQTEAFTQVKAGEGNITVTCQRGQSLTRIRTEYSQESLLLSQPPPVIQGQSQEKTSSTSSSTNPYKSSTTTTTTTSSSSSIKVNSNFLLYL